MSTFPLSRSLSLVQAAVLLKVSRRTIYNRIARGQLETITVNGSQRVLRESLPTWAREEDVPLPLDQA